MELLDTLGWRAMGFRNRLIDRFWERRLRIHTTGSVEVHQPDANRYATFSYVSIRRILSKLDLAPRDVFVDIGCGKGRVVCCAAKENVQRVIGVEIDSALCDLARANADILPAPHAPIEIVNSAAQEFDYATCTAFFLFNSFGAETLERVIESIEQSWRANRRSLKFVYVNPFHEHVLRESSLFEMADRWQRQPWSGLKFDVSFWRSRDS